MPRGEGHSQRRADNYRSFKNAQTMLDIRKQLFSNLKLSSDEFASDPFNIKLQSRVDTELARREKSHINKTPTKEFIKQLVAADLYYHDPVLCSAVAPEQEESVTPIPSLTLCVNHVSVSVVDKDICITDGFIPLGCEGQDVLTPNGVAYNEHSYVYNDSIQEVLDLKAEVRSLKQRSDILNNLSVLPPEMIEEVGGYLTCRDKLLIMMNSEIRFKPCKKRTYHVLVESATSYGTYSRNCQDVEHVCRYNKCFCKYYYVNQNRENRCVCQSLLWTRPYLIDDPRFKWSIRHVGNHYGKGLKAIAFVYNS